MLFIWNWKKSDKFLDNFYCALFLTKEGLFVPITDRDEFLKLFCIGSMNAESVFKLMPIGKEIAAIINDAPCKVKLVKLCKVKKFWKFSF